MLDNNDDIICPACGEAMDKVFINSIQKNIDICLKGCGGLFLDNREFEKIDEQHEDVSEILSLTEGKEFKSVDDTKLRVCAYCGANMVKSNVFGVLIDTCYTCGAKFLDNNELATYRSQYPTDSERSKVFNAMLNVQITGQGVAPNVDLTKAYVEEASKGSKDTVIYSEPPMNPFKKLIVNLFKFFHKDEF